MSPPLKADQWRGLWVGDGGIPYYSANIVEPWARVFVLRLKLKMFPSWHKPVILFQMQTHYPWATEDRLTKKGEKHQVYKVNPQMPIILHKKITESSWENSQVTLFIKQKESPVTLEIVAPPVRSFMNWPTIEFDLGDKPW